MHQKRKLRRKNEPMNKNYNWNFMSYHFMDHKYFYDLRSNSIQPCNELMLNMKEMGFGTVI